MAAYIREQVPGDAPIIAAGDLVGTGVASYLPERVIWYPPLEQKVSFVTWDQDRGVSISFEEAKARVRRKYPQADKMYLLCGENSNISDLGEYLPQMSEKIRADAYIGQESFTLYCAEL